MTANTPLAVVHAFVDAMNRGDLEAAVAHYDSDAVLVVQPGVVARGRSAIETALAGMLALRPTLTSDAQEVLALDDLALYHSRWSLSGRDPTGDAVTLSGQSSDVLRRGPGGEWKIAIDNPWGTAVLDAPAAVDGSSGRGD
jgi:uncharacterized protein (TIGR02246 family)